MIKYFTLCLSILFFTSHIQSQSVEWVIEPIITDADMITTNEYQQDEINLIAFKKDGKWGMKNAKNELLAPPEFDGAQVWRTGKYFDMREGRVQRFFDSDGYEIDFAEVDAYQKQVQARKKIKDLENTIEELEEKHKLVNFDLKDKRIIAINKESGDTISTRVSTKRFYMNELGYFVEPEIKTRRLLVKDSYGDIIRTLEDNTKISEIKSNLFLVRNGSKEGLLDSKGNVIFKTEYEDIGFVSDNYIKISKEGDVLQLVDLEGKPVSDMFGESIYKSRMDNKIIIKKSKYETIIFDETTKKAITYPFSLVGRVINKSIYQVKNSDTLSGFYNIVKDEEIIPCKYRRVKREGAYFVVGNYKISKSKKRRKLVQFKSIINIKGDVILQDSMSGVRMIDNKLIAVYGTGNTAKIYKVDGTLVGEIDKISSLRSSPNPKYFTITKSDYGYITVEQYLAGNTKSTYDSVGKIESNRSKTKKYTKVQKDNKYGLIDELDNIIIPLEMDEIIMDSAFKKYTLIKKNNKWGVIKNILNQ